MKRVDEVKCDAINAMVKENRKKEEKDVQNKEKTNDINNQADKVKFFDKEDACQKEDKERENKDSHRTMIGEGEEMMVLEAKSAVKENEKKEEEENKTKKNKNGNKEEIIYTKKQVEAHIMELVEVDKRANYDGSKEEEKYGVHEHEVSDREENVEQSQEVLEGEAKGNVGNQEMDNSEQNVKEK